MIELDGNTYIMQTPTECAYDCVNYINQYCADNNITNSKGEVIYIDVSPTNILYMIIFGISYLISIVQKLIYSVGCGFNYNTASSRQLLNLASLAGTSKRKATKTTITGTVWASYTESLTITTSETATLNINGTTIVFTPTYAININAGESAKIILIADIYGTFSISANTITAFDNDISGLRLFTTEDSVPGTNEESDASLRRRLLLRTSSSTNIDRCIEAINDLEGISRCSIYYNNSNTLSTTIEGTTVPPRHALIMIQGYNENIAKTYLSYMNAPTVQVSGGLEQDYTTKANQVIPVYYTSPMSLPMYVRVYVTGIYAESIKESIKDSILSYTASLDIGESVSTNDILKVLNNTTFDTSVDFDYVDISTDGESYGYIVSPDIVHILNLSYSNILIVEV